MPEPRRLIAIHLAPASRLPMRSVTAAELRTDGGIVGDRYENARHRHVSIQTTDELDAASAARGAPVEAGRTRRNLTVTGPPLRRTPGTRLRLGASVELEVVRVAAPCKVMDDAVGPGAHLAMRHRGGVIFRVLTGGPIATGDLVIEDEAR